MHADSVSEFDLSLRFNLRIKPPNSRRFCIYFSYYALHSCGKIRHHCAYSINWDVKWEAHGKYIAFTEEKKGLFSGNYISVSRNYDVASYNYEKTSLDS